MTAARPDELDAPRPDPRLPPQGEPGGGGRPTPPADAPGTDVPGADLPETGVPGVDAPGPEEGGVRPGELGRDAPGDTTARDFPAYDGAEVAGPADAPTQVRPAGPRALRDKPQDGWDEVDEAMDETFPASDPPATY